MAPWTSKPLWNTFVVALSQSMLSAAAEFLDSGARRGILPSSAVLGFGRDRISSKKGTVQKKYPPHTKTTKIQEDGAVILGRSNGRNAFRHSPFLTTIVVFALQVVTDVGREASKQRHQKPGVQSIDCGDEASRRRCQTTGKRRQKG